MAGKGRKRARSIRLPPLTRVPVALALVVRQAGAPPVRPGSFDARSFSDAFDIGGPISP